MPEYTLEVVFVSVSKSLFGIMPDGKEVHLYTVENKGIRAEFISYGCILKSLVVKDKNKNDVDVVLGRDTLEEYLNNGGCLGETVGRFANRINNAEFELDGKIYKISANEGKNCLHGGTKGFSKYVWDCNSFDPDSSAISFEMTSPDGDQGFPGNLNVIVTFTLTDDNALDIHYEAVCDKDTVINLTNHSYFNLNGHDSGDMLSHKLKINGGFVTLTDDKQIPHGEIVSVKGSPFDFTEFKSVGQDINADVEQVKIAGGYDHNWVLSGRGMKEAAVLVGDKTGIKMTTYTDKPAVQIYTCNGIDSERKYKNGAVYHARQGICLETQYFPNSIEVSHFPSPILKCGEKYDTTTRYSFGIEN